MKKIILNDSRQIGVQSANAVAGILRIRMINTSIETLEALFSSEFATSKMTLFENNKVSSTFENYTAFKSVKKECGGIYEVELRQTLADDATRLASLEDAVKIVTKGDAQLFSRFLEAQMQTLSDEQAVKFVEFAPAWELGETMDAGTKVQYNGELYKVLQTHTSQASWTPDTAPSLFARVLIPEDGTTPEWQQPDSTNGYSVGDVVTHNDKTWESLVDDNTWEPGVTGTETVWKEVI